MNKKRFVAVADVLGFKNLFEEDELDVNTIYEKYKVLLDEVKRVMILQQIQIGHGSQSLYPPIIQILTRFPAGSPITRAMIPHQIFSDTILFWTENDVLEEVDLLEKVDLLEEVYLFFLGIVSCINVSIHLGLPLRIGIAFGDTIIDTERNIYIGKPIINAHLLESAQRWIGAACHISVNESDMIKEFLGEPFFNIVDYPEIPLKNYELKNCIGVINWPHQEGYRRALGGKDTRIVLERLRMKNRCHKNAKCKYDNTISFYDKYVDLSMYERMRHAANSVVYNLISSYLGLLGNRRRLPIR